MEDKMTKPVTGVKLGVIGILLLGLAGATEVVAAPPEIVLTQNAVNRIMGDAERYVSALAAKCDKCDSSTRSDAQKAAAALRSAIGELERTTNKKFDEVAKTCK
jgi:hypothetical protein